VTRPNSVGSISVGPPNTPVSGWGNVTLSFRDVGGNEVAAFTIDPGQRIAGKRYRTAGDHNPNSDPMVQAVPETAVSWVLDWQLLPGPPS
jgi:hypothetical protein